MVAINSHYQKLKAGYLFPEINRRVAEFTTLFPEKASDLIRCGIGDVTQPLPLAAREAMHQAIDELGEKSTFKGYGPEQGYSFLRSLIAQEDYQKKGIQISEEEIFISDGSKCDGGSLLDILGEENQIAVMDPVYPVYVDTNVMAGRTGAPLLEGGYEGIYYLPCHEENDFIPEVPKNGKKLDLIYLCFPNNPTGAVISRQALQEWVDYARFYGSLILFDAAYESYISDPNIPHSIYEIEGAKECAIELRSFSKNGGFTGVRCGFTVLPKQLYGHNHLGEKKDLHSLWHRRFTTKFNGVSYITQKGAAALYSPQGKKEIQSLISYYLENAALLREAFIKQGLRVYGGVHAPYLWIKTPQNQQSWSFFDWMLREKQIVVTPGSGFGSAGEGFFRLSAFNDREVIKKVVERVKDIRS